MSLLRRMGFSQIKGGNLLKALSVPPARSVLFETCSSTRQMMLLSSQQHKGSRQDKLAVTSLNMEPSGCLQCVRNYAKKFKKEKKGTY